MAEEGGQSRLDEAGSASTFNQHAFTIDQALTRIRTSVVVKIVAVHGGGVGPAPTVDVQPLVKQVDGQGGSATSHGTIYGIPCTRSQAGDSVIINDPVVGDIGTMVIHDRDISSLKANNGQESTPGSYRRHDPADGVYHGPILNQTKPTQYIQFLRDSSGKANGLKIVDNVGNTIISSSNGVNINGLIIDKNGNLTTPGGVQAGTGTADSVTLQNHLHPTVPKPTPGT